MAITDPISDMLTRIRNARMVHKETVAIPNSKLKIEILKVLKKEGYISDFEVEKNGLAILVSLNGSEMNKIVRVSKPGRRVYTSSDNIPKVLQGHGLLVMSTSKGVMSGEEARRASLGGEILCKVW